MQRANLMQVTQVYFNDTNSPPPEPIVSCINSVRSGIYDLPHFLYDLDAARSLLQQHTGIEVVTAFDKLRPYAYKADLFRYFALYAFGGWYFDCTVKLQRSIIIPENCRSVAFRDFPRVTNSSWSVWNGALFSRPGHPVYETAIDLVLENCRNNYYGTCNLCPTGPVLLGRAFARHGVDPGNLFFNCVYLTPGYTVKNPALVLSDGEIFAHLKNSGRVGLEGYGAHGTNDYAELYSLNDIYDIS